MARYEASQVESEIRSLARVRTITIVIHCHWRGAGEVEFGHGSSWFVGFYKEPSISSGLADWVFQ